MARGKSFQASSAPAAALSSKSTPVSHGPPPVNDTDEAILELYGQSIPGEHKWLGAAVADDGAIYGVPAHNRRAVRVVPATGEVTELGDDDTLSDRNFKYLRGIRTAAGTILGIPAWAENVLEITPSTGEVRTIGKLTTPQTNMKRWKWMWHGAAAGLDECIYGIPSNADGVLKINPHTREVTTFGADAIPPGQNRWYGGIRGPDGCIYGMPYTADHVLKIVPGENPEVHMMGDFSDVPGGWRWHGGVLAPDGCIYAFPSHAPRVLKIDCVAGTVTLIGPEFEGRYKWGGGAVGLDGNVYGMPSDTDCVLRIRCATEEVDVIGEGVLRI